MMTTIGVVVVLVSLAAMCCVLANAQGLKRVCYFRRLKWVRPGTARYTPEDMDTELCSHINFLGVTVVDGVTQPSDPVFESTPRRQGWFERFTTHIHQTGQSVKAIISVLGVSRDPHMTQMLHNETTRSVFIHHIIAFAVEREFDGIDLDFEAPADTRQTRADKQKFTLLCQGMRAAIEAMQLRPGQEKLLFTIAANAGGYYIKRSFDVPQLCQVLDHVNLMTYDMGVLGNTNRNAKHHSPLFPPLGGTTSHTQDNSARLWLDEGCAAEKIVVGMALYGYRFELTDPANNAMNAPIVRQSQHALSYSNICRDYLFNAGTVVMRDEVQKVPYLALDNHWIGYDDAQSLSNKVLWLRVRGFGGWMVWVMDHDDWQSDICHQGVNPLLHALNRASTPC